MNPANTVLTIPIPVQPTFSISFMICQIPVPSAYGSNEVIPKHNAISFGIATTKDAPMINGSIYPIPVIK